MDVFDLEAAPVDPQWTTAEAIAFARTCELVAPLFGFHTALTGGCLYKDGLRKDCDIVFYQTGWMQSAPPPEPDREGLVTELEKHGLHLRINLKRVTKAWWHGKSVDLIFPHLTTRGDVEEYQEAHG